MYETHLHLESHCKFIIDYGPTLWRETHIRLTILTICTALHTHIDVSAVLNFHSTLQTVDMLCSWLSWCCERRDICLFISAVTALWHQQEPPLVHSCLHHNFHPTDTIVTWPRDQNKAPVLSSALFIEFHGLNKLDRTTQRTVNVIRQNPRKDRNTAVITLNNKLKRLIKHIIWKSNE